MTTRARRRRHVDMGRLREALRGPDVDTRVWLSSGRVVDDPLAVRWDVVVGLVADVALYGGQLEGEEVTCRVGAAFAGQAVTAQAPLRAGDEVVVLIPDGDANAGPVIVGRVHNVDAVPPPVVCGVPTAAAILANHVLVSGAGRLEQLGGPVRQQAPAWAIEAAAIVLAGQVQLGATVLPDGTVAVPATHPFVLGDRLVMALEALLGALDAYSKALGTGSGLDPVLVGTAATAATALGAAIVAVRAQLAQVLSTRVAGQ